MSLLFFTILIELIDLLNFIGLVNSNTTNLVDTNGYSKSFLDGMLKKSFCV